jgi:hypothetical protein
MSTPEPDSVPHARVEPERSARWTRLLPLFALLLAAYLVRAAWRERGPRLVIHAADGHGLEPGDALRHRGIEVGEVTAVGLAPDARGVVLEVRLARSARALARAGARFWIARPVLGVEGVRGLETALGGRHLGALPGPEGAPFQREFTALEEPPLSEAEDPAALEVVLRAGARGGLARGAPVLYRGIAIGTLVSVALADDASAVEARARIHARYAELVRVDSRFWRTGGARFDLGFAGLALSVESLQALWLGGVALSTPTHPGARASTGQGFELVEEPEPEWLGWRPALALGTLPGAPQLPERVYARLTYEPSGWFARARARAGWLVRGAGELFGPADLLEAPAGAEPESVFLELAGERVALTAPPVWSADGLARRSDPADPAATAARPPSGPPLSEAEDLLLCADPALAPMAVGAADLVREGATWRIAARLPLDERWHGAVALTRAQGRWVGFVLVAAGEARLVPVPDE